MCKQTSLAPTLVCPLSISPSVRLSDFHSNSLKVLTNRRYNIVVADMDEDKLADKKKYCQTWWPTWRWIWWPTWSWTMWPTKKSTLTINMEIQIGERVGHGVWSIAPKLF